VPAVSDCVEPLTTASINCIVQAIRTLSKSAFPGCIVSILLWIPNPVAAQISPGPLSRAHQSINGVTECASCHEISAGKPIFRCLDCHAEIAARIGARKGLHATYGIKPGSSLECVNCHSEHNGVDFILTKLDPKTFDHNTTGYKLEGSHAGVNCNRCHAPEHISESERTTIKIKDLSKSYLGVSPGCSNCHRDRHEGRLGANCLQCHNYLHWESINIVQFNHSLTRYPLTGLHGRVPCQQCHTPGNDKQPRFTGIPFRKCSDCHADPHRGGFLEPCQSCHSTTGWNKVLKPGLSRAFDHSKTKFLLLGRHAEVECVRCHGKGDFKQAIAFQKCSDCHRPDPHGGQFAKREGGAECSNCHSVEGFEPSTFGLKEHARTSYPLQGKHAMVRCAQCHVPREPFTIYRIKFQACTECHVDAHAAQFEKAPHLNRCEDCHSLQRFRPSTFSLSRHNKSAFELSGSHLAVPCSDCHKTPSTFTPTPTVQYHWSGVRCTNCHSDPHQGRFGALLQPTKANRAAAGCEGCHSSETWVDLSRFDHSKTAFPLLGTHKTTTCTKCHIPRDPKVGISVADFKARSPRCEACHADSHLSQFAKAGVTQCANCHDSTSWKPSSFDHDRQTTFPLQGAHRNVRCASCHKSVRVVAGRSVPFYKPTPKPCVACHGADTRTSGAVLGAIKEGDATRTTNHM
jgi:hypothetical protein